MNDSLIRLGTSEEVFSEFYKNSHIEGRYTAYIRGVRCKKYNSFLAEYSAAFQFPSYFGMNWNAWYECAWDLDWLKFDSIAIVIDDFDLLFSREFNPKKAKTLFEKDMLDLQKYWQEEQGVLCNICLFQHVYAED